MSDFKRKVIIDTDCGSDDAMAIAMALNDKSVEIMFFVAVHGNVPMEQAAINTLTTIEYSNSYEPPVYRGCETPLIRKSEFAYETHGVDGMGGIGLKPEKLKIADGYGILKMLEALEESEDGEIEIITLGTLTNIAIAIKMAPETMKKAKRISMMGTSGLGVGNVTPVAEFNIWQDAEAAKIVFDSGLPILAVGWDACLGEAMLWQKDIDKIKNGSKLGKFTIDCNKQLAELNRERFGENVLDMADPAAMAAILYPECIKENGEYYCEIDINNGIGYGNAMIYDCEYFADKKPNSEICSALDGGKFKDYLFKTLCESQES